MPKLDIFYHYEKYSYTFNSSEHLLLVLKDDPCTVFVKQENTNAPNLCETF